MSDIKRRVATGIVASFGLYIMFEVYPVCIFVLSSAFHLTVVEYYQIMRKAYQKHLATDMINDAGTGTLGVYLTPILFFFSFTIQNKEACVCMTIILTSFVCIAYRLYQYSIFCSKSKNPDPVKAYSFTCLVTILGDILFCVCIGFPFSYSFMISNLE